MALARTTTRRGDTPRYVPTEPVHNLRRWEGRYRKRFAKFRGMLLSTPLFANIARFAELCDRLGIRLVVMVSPVHPLLLTTFPNGEADYRAFLERLRATAESSHALFFDPTEDGSGIGKPELFYDTIHPNSEGGTWLSRRIGRFLVDSGTLDRHSP